ncbi:hypothetical protein IDJ77_11340 [Mucilaginibacter sp. ZT4R22]|uniref:Uncharacterized protein n=1 Tax=Mucilaginibacter pankratovii TaxID=2772110 RepID=A0ABR7WQ00_9SPHI|nr:hypothetical protein [Mucilaginibacter pankratovii]MBD1364403.1 hypothetical protein [Mucilaginibacter pankratovii]
MSIQNFKLLTAFAAPTIWAALVYGAYLVSAILRWPLWILPLAFAVVFGAVLWMVRVMAVWTFEDKKNW